MKKILSIALVLMLLLGCLPMGLSFSASAAEGDSLPVYKKFTFGAGNQVAYTVNESVNYKGNTFKPLQAYTSGSTSTAASVSYVDVTDEAGIKHNMLRLSAAANVMFTPLDNEGKPFEVKPGKQYQVKLKAYNIAANNWSQFWVCLTGNNEEIKNAYDNNHIFVDAGYYLDKKAVTAGAWCGGVIHTGYSGGANRGVKVKDMSNYLATPSAIPVATNEGGTASDSTVTLGRLTATKTGTNTVASAENSPNATYQGSQLVRYDSENDTYYFNYPYYGNKSDSIYTGNTDAGYKGVKEYNNYLNIFISGGHNSVLGTDFILDIEEIEIFEVGAQTTVTYYDGEGEISTGTAALGSTLADAPAKSGFKFVGWYKDITLLVPYEDDTVMGDNLKLYAKYIDLSEKINIKYYNGDNLIKSEKVSMYGDIWQAVNSEAGVLKGWYTDKELTEKYTSTTAEMSDLTLYGDFKPYVNEVSVTSWPNIYSKVNYRHYNGTEWKDTYSVCGWNKTTKDFGDNKLHMYCSAPWVQGGAYIFHDPATGDMFVPEPGATYDVSITYQLVQTQEPNFEKLTLSIGAGMKTANNGNLSNKNFEAYEVVDMVDDVMAAPVTKTARITAPAASDTVVPALGFHINFGKSNPSDEKDDGTVKEDVIVTNVTIKKLTVAGTEFGGASVLTEAAANTAGKQAMRVYYSYKLNANGKIDFEGKEYSVIERGVLIKNADSDAAMSIDNVNKGGLFSVAARADLDNCWNYDSATGTVTYSAYVTGFKPDDDREITTRGYIILENGLVCYTAMATNSVMKIAEINADMEDYKEPTEKENITVMLVIGQSNAQGAGYNEEFNIYKNYKEYYTFSAQPTSGEYGQVYVNKQSPITALLPQYDYSYMLAQANDKDQAVAIAGISSPFAYEWNRLTGEKVVVLHTAVGSTSLAEWQKDANVEGAYKELADPSGKAGYNGTFYLYKNTVDYYNQTVEALSQSYNINHSFFVWNQGESDQNITGNQNRTINSDATYAQYFSKMVDDLRADCPGLQGGTIIAVRSSSQAYSGATYEARRAQYRVAATRDDVQLSSWLTEAMNKRMPNWTVNGITEPANGADYDLVGNVKGCHYGSAEHPSYYSSMHYTQKRYNEMGAEAAQNYFKYLNGQSEFDGVAIYNRNGTHLAEHLIGKFDVNGNGEFKITNTKATDFLQIRAEDASVEYDISLSVDIESAKLIIDVYTNGKHYQSGDGYITEFGEINWTALNAVGITELTAICNIH